MPVFHSGHFRVFWNVLMDAAFRSDQVGDDSEVTIVSPWISDVMTSESGWSDSALSSAFGTHGGNIESLSDVLGNLVSLGYKVTVVTLSTTGKWLPKSRNAHHDNERRFLEKVSRRGVSCLVRNDVHMKYIATPFSLMDGSINISFNGLSGRNHESANLYFREDQEQDYLQRRARISAVLVGAKDYFSSRVPITDWVPPQFHASPGAAAPDLSTQPDLSFPAVSDEEYPRMAPADFSTVGSAQIGGRPEIVLSLKAQCSQLLHWTGVWALELLSNETVEGLDHASVHSSIVGPDADGELSPSPSAIRERLLSDQDQNAQHSVRTRLGLLDEDVLWQQWRGLAGDLVGGLEYLSDRIANGEEPTDDDFETLSRLNSLYDRLHQR